MKKANQIVYARRCCKTGEGMNEGWIFGNGDMYIKHESDVIKELRGPDWKDFWSEAWTELSEREDADILDSAFEHDICHWTEWDPSEEDEWYTRYGEPLKTKDEVNKYLKGEDHEDEGVAFQDYTPKRAIYTIVDADEDVEAYAFTDIDVYLQEWNDLMGTNYETIKQFNATETNYHIYVSPPLA
tara:strand:+ start:70 stop:624 length:555 start_codon:yes stop_codon:yes gene_type:complete